ncbi:MAG: EAL domain-containing protein [Neomegalonema sp.]|nr:EAL domain-containing protein [Neomegalonema sp.]
MFSFATTPGFLAAAGAAAMLLFGAVTSANMLGRAAADRGSARIAALMTGAACLGAALWSAMVLSERLTIAPMDGVAILVAAVLGCGLLLFLMFEAIEGGNRKRRIAACAALAAVAALVVLAHVHAMGVGAVEQPATVLSRLALAGGAGALGVRLAFRHRRFSHFVIAAAGVCLCVLAELAPTQTAPPLNTDDIETHSIFAPPISQQEGLAAVAMAVALMTLWIGASTFSSFSFAFASVNDRRAGRNEAAVQALSPNMAFSAAGVSGPGANGSGMNGSSMGSDEDAIGKAMAASLADALTRNEIDLDYQPQWRLEDGRLIGAEALARWRRGPEAGAPPNVFAAAAEKFGVIDQLGAYVLNKACLQATRWPEHLHVAVNVSPLQLQNPDFEAQLRETLQRTGLSPRRLELEVTESAFSEGGDFDPEMLKRLRAAGLTVSIDDFGKGHSSLARLQELEVDCIKLDRAVAGQVLVSETARAITRSLVGLAQQIGVKVLAEGLETTEEISFHRDAGCAFGQGYGMGRPMRESDFPKSVPAWPLSS